MLIRSMARWSPHFPLKPKLGHYTNNTKYKKEQQALAFMGEALTNCLAFVIVLKLQQISTRNETKRGFENFRVEIGLIRNGGRALNSFRSRHFVVLSTEIFV